MTPTQRNRMQEAELKRLSRVKASPPRTTAALGPEMIEFFKQSVQKRQVKLAAIAECWARLVPPMLNDHCALESLTRGSLVVLVDSSSHLYELKQLLLSGLQKQLLLACKATGLRKIALKSGRWYDEGDGDRTPRFEKRASG